LGNHRRYCQRDARQLDGRGVGGEYAFLYWLADFGEYHFYAFGNNRNAFICGVAAIKSSDPESNRRGASASPGLFAFVVAPTAKSMRIGMLFWAGPAHLGRVRRLGNVLQRAPVTALHRALEIRKQLGSYRRYLYGRISKRIIRKQRCKMKIILMGRF